MAPCGKMKDGRPEMNLPEGKRILNREEGAEEEEEEMRKVEEGTTRTTRFRKGETLLARR